ncbi:MAG: hypothetical protein WA063_05810 [Minisyncoccia bacterium]
MKKKEWIAMAIVAILAIILASGCLEEKKKIAEEAAQVTPVGTAVELPESTPAPANEAAGEPHLSVHGYVMLFPNVLPSEVKTKDDYDYIVRVTIENDGSGILIFDTARSYFELGGSSLASEKYAYNYGLEEWKLAPFETLRLDFSTKGYTREFHNITQKTGKKEITFTVGVLNDGKLVDRPYNTTVPALEKLSESGIDALSENQLVFSPVTLTHR